MKWQEIRTHYPDQWVLVEALQAHNEGDRRIIEDFAVVDTFPDSVSGLRAYEELHQRAPEREYLVVHTSREELDITVRYWTGIRGRQWRSAGAIIDLAKLEVRAV